MYSILMDTVPTTLQFNDAPATTQAAVVNQPTFTDLITQHPMAAVAAGAMAAMIFGWFAMRYWLTVTRPAAIKTVETPRINSMNAAALDHMVGESAEEAEAELEAMRHEAAPDDLLAVIPPEEIEIKPTKPHESK